MICWQSSPKHQATTAGLARGWQANKYPELAFTRAVLIIIMSMMSSVKIKLSCHPYLESTVPNQANKYPEVTIKTTYNYCTSS